MTSTETGGVSAPYLGPILLGTLFNACLAGAVCQQFYTYWISGFGDTKRVRAFVVTQFTVIMLQCVVAMQALWNIFIHNYGIPLHTTQWIWQSLVNSLCQCILVWSANVFLAIRIYVLTKSRFQCGLVIALSSSAFILGIITSVSAWRQLKALESHPLPVTEITRSENAASTAWHGLQAISECLITILLTRALMNARTGLRKSDSIVNYIVRNVVQIGLLGALCSLAELATWFLFPSTTVYEIFDITVGSIYTNVIFDTLLSRVQLRERLAESSHINDTASMQLHTAVFRALPVTKVLDGDRGVASIISVGSPSLATFAQGPPEEDDIESNVHSPQSSDMNCPLARNLATSSN